MIGHSRYQCFTVWKEKSLVKLQKSLVFRTGDKLYRCHVLVAGIRRFENRSTVRNAIWDVLRRMVRISHTGYLLNRHESEKIYIVISIKL